MNQRITISRREEELINKQRNKINFPETESGHTLSSVLGGIEEEYSEVEHTIYKMSTMLTDAERRLGSMEHKIVVEEQGFRDQLQFIFFNYLPSNNSKNYSDTLGPVDKGIFETDYRVGEFNIGKLLGDGNYANVYIGMHRPTREQYALKRIQKNRMLSLNKLLQLEKELKVLRFVQHPNVIRMHSLIHAPSYVYLVLELGHGDLFHYLRDNAHGLTLDSVREIAIGVLRGLEYLHSHGIAHMDIKEENILVSTNVDISKLSREHIKICDLGLVQIQTDLSKPISVHRVAGTPGFFAPEMVLDLANTDGRRADMWSFGALLIEVTEGLDKPWMHAYSHFKTDKKQFYSGMVQCLIDFYHRFSFPDFELHDLIVHCLRLRSEQRLTASSALDHVWIGRKYDPDEDEETVWHHRHTL